MSTRHMLVVVALAACLVLAGCAASTRPKAGFVPSQPPQPGGTSVMPPPDPMASHPATDAADAKPGVYPLPGGRSQVIGTLQWGTLGSRTGCYVLARYPWQPLTSETEALAYIVNADPHVAYSTNGRYVTVDGALGKAASLAIAPGQEGGPIEVKSGSFAWARVEKPNVQRMPDGTLRAVGILARVGDYRGVRVGSMAVLGAGPAEDPYVPSAGGWSRVNAFVRYVPDMPWSRAVGTRGTVGKYVAIQGPQVGAIKATGTPWPIVEARSLTIIATPGP